MEAAIVLVLAIALDFVFGEPPNAVHPVGWIGRLIGLLVSWAPKRSRATQLLYGAMMVAATIALLAGLCFLLLSVLAAISPLLYIVFAALVLKSTFSLRALLRAAGCVRQHLDASDLPGARAALSALVSRDTAALGPEHLAAAAIESVAENTVDSFMAPLFYFVLFAPAGPLAPALALAYRAANTFDSMVGYHGRYEYLGKVAARLDDLLNWAPARLGAVFIIGAAALRADAGSAWRVMARDRGLTESPNAGWTMSAAAGALQVTLEKIGHYRLGDGDPPEPHTIDEMGRLALAAMLMFAGLCVIILLATT